MKRKIFFIRLLLMFILAISLPAHAVFIGNSQGGAEFPQGNVSFADTVTSYMPGMVGYNPTTPHLGANNALGLPDYAGVNTCASQEACTFVTLGDGGSIVLRFDDNKLTGSGDNAVDLWVFEVGPDIEDTFIDISKDGLTWYSVGKVFGSTAGIDIDAYGFTPSDLFAYVRLTDDPNEGDQDGITVGADIDAVGAISTVPTPVPVPGSFWLMMINLLFIYVLLSAKRSRRNTSATL